MTKSSSRKKQQGKQRQGGNKAKCTAVSEAGQETVSRSSASCPANTDGRAPTAATRRLRHSIAELEQSEEPDLTTQNKDDVVATDHGPAKLPRSRSRSRHSNVRADKSAASDTSQTVTSVTPHRSRVAKTTPSRDKELLSASDVEVSPKGTPRRSRTSTTMRDTSAVLSQNDDTDIVSLKTRGKKPPASLVKDETDNETFKTPKSKSTSQRGRPSTQKKTEVESNDKEPATSTPKMAKNPAPSKSVRKSRKQAGGKLNDSFENKSIDESVTKEYCDLLPSDITAASCRPLLASTPAAKGRKSNRKAKTKRDVGKDAEHVDSQPVIAVGVDGTDHSLAISDVSSQVQDEDSVMEQTDDVGMGSTSGRRRRSAALKARTSLKSMAKEILQSKVENTARPIQSMYEVLVEALPTEEVLVRWSTQKSGQGCMFCPYEGCIYKNSALNCMRQHYMTCDRGKKIPGYRCLECGKTYAAESSMRSHVQKHQKEMKEIPREASDDSDKDPDVRVESDSDDDYDDDDDSDEDASGDDSDEVDAEDDEDEAEDGASNKKSSRKKGVDKRPSRHKPSSKSSSKSGKYPSVVFSYDIDNYNEKTERLLDNLYELYEECCQGGLFWTWRPRQPSWKLLSHSEREKYMPVMKQSPSFTVKTGFGQRFTVQLDETTLELFESVAPKNILCYVGGPVRAMDWCPVPVEEKNASHYLALHAGRHPDLRHYAHETLNQPALIQIWNFDNLMPSKPAEMCLAIAVDHGPVSDLKWCPFGVYEKPLDIKGQWYNRLGLLALAGCDGSVHLYSIPHPHQLPQQSHPIYLVKPEAKLVPSLHSEKGAYGACLCLDWQWKDGAKRIFAGFGKGQVAIWQLDAESLLLHKEDEDGMEMFAPVISFRAHLEPVTGIAVCQNVPEYFATTSTDRFAKVWDVKRTDTPINYYYRLFMTGVLWPIFRGFIFISQDSAGGEDHCYVVDSGYFGHRTRPLTVHTDCVWGMDYNHWLGVHTSVDAAGHMVLTKLPQSIAGMSYWYQKSFYKLCHNAIATTVDLHKKDTAPIQKTPVKDRDEGKKGQLDLSEWEREEQEEEQEEEQDEEHEDIDTDDSDDLYFARPSFEDLHKSCHITYYNEVVNDSLLQEKLSKTKVSGINGQKPRSHDASQLQIQALYKVKWNLNLARRTWLAVGGQAGILQVINMPAFDVKKLSKKVS